MHVLHFPFMQLGLCSEGKGYACMPLQDHACTLPEILHSCMRASTARFCTHDVHAVTKGMHPCSHAAGRDACCCGELYYYDAITKILFTSTKQPLLQMPQKWAPL